MNELQIQAMIAEVVKVMRDTKKGKLPDYQHGYAHAVRMAQDLAVHALGKKGNRLMDRKVPNETDAQRAYRMSSLEPFTMPYWAKAQNAIQGRIWNDSNYTIEDWQTEEQDGEKIYTEQRKYFLEDFPKYGSIINYFRSVRLPKKLYDANAVMVVKPWYIPTIEVDGKMVVNDAAMIQAITIIYDAEQVIHFDDLHTLVLTKEKSIVRVGQQDRKEGLVFEVYDDMFIWKVEQVGDQKDWRFEVFVYYQHDLGIVPAWRLGGVPLDNEDGLPTYQSYFYPALSGLNQAYFDESTLNISKISHTYPERWEVRSKCTHSTCDGGKILNHDYDPEDRRSLQYIDCPACGGSGYKPHPLNTIVVTLPDRLDADTPNSQPPTPPAGFLDKDIKTPEFLRKEIDRQKQDAFANLNIDISTKPNGQTATESKIDREELFSLLLHISSEEFEALNYAIWSCGQMMWGSDFVMPAIDPPTDFTIRSYLELTEEISAAREQKIPLVAFRRLIEEYIAARFASDKRLTKITDLVFFTDRLIMATDQEVNMMLLNKTASITEAILHQSIYTFIEQLVNEDERFVNKPMEEQSQLITQKAETVKANIQAAQGNNADILQSLTA